ncbi:transporter substrate-binding domain-containing protein [Herbaspirillum sp. YR522]|uniref:transporter substrate-binding domain-containing protein n=1 Tax=Herbaspirillum sp. YR522 TaxID=1144342 RepID=UPI00026FC46F|nr:transporter substrate-binding domain-containing protein [Herbaspirillum sp. YR522]EJN09600.1 periplasmic component of amino acid ABC-type transporter/signal transduction system [Herbaspirillum sp. YR522]
MRLPALIPLLLMCAATAGAGVLDDARQAGALRVGLDYVPPVYKGGMKFRTPERIDTVLAEDLAGQFKLKPDLVGNGPDAARSFRGARADVVLTLAGDGEAPTADTVVIPTGYSAGGMAIMRTDTTIKKWEDLKGRTVCMSEGGPYVGSLASRYGAVEKVMRAPADALLAVRVGECDAAVHDDAMMKTLLKLPEWKKFSAQLAPTGRRQLVLKVRGADAADLAALRQAAARWSDDYWAGVKKKWANDVAFEVYLDQNVPDCH